MIKSICPVVLTTSLLLTSTPTLSSIVPTEAETFNYNVRTINMSRDSEDKVYEALELVRTVVAMNEFREAILQHRFKGRRDFANNRGLSNDEIYLKILAGAETLNPEEDNTMDMEVQLFTDHDSRTIGYTWSNTSRIWINTKYFHRRGPASIAGTLMHEWLHKLGFGHDHDPTEARKFSVPYAIGNLVEGLAAKIEEGPYRPELLQEEYFWTTVGQRYRDASASGEAAVGGH